MNEGLISFYSFVFRCMTGCCRVAERGPAASKFQPANNKEEQGLLLIFPSYFSTIHANTRTAHSHWSRASKEEKITISPPRSKQKLSGCQAVSHTGSSPVDRDGACRLNALRRRDWLLCASSQTCHSDGLTTGPVAGPEYMRHTVS